MRLLQTDEDRKQWEGKKIFGAEHHLHRDNVLQFYESGLVNATCFNPKFLLVKVQDQAEWCQTAAVVDRAKVHEFDYWFKAILVNKTLQATSSQLPSIHR